MDAYLYFPIHHLANGQQLDAKAQIVGNLHVLRRNLRNALTVDIRHAHACVKGQRSQDCQLELGVVTLDIVGGVRLSIAQLLCLPERLAIAQPPPGSSCS